MVKKSISLVSSILASVDPSDLGSAAYKDTGTGAGQIPILDSNGKLNTSTIPAVAITDVFVASSQQDMLALTAEKGDVCVRTDENKTYVLSDSPASTLSNWIELLNTIPVQSVNGKIGAVTLDADDVGAVTKNNAITGATKCKITYDSKGLVTAGSDLQSSDIPDLSSSYVATNGSITGATKCKITYDSKGLVTAGADLQSSDIPDLSSSYTAANAAITGNTKCKITYDSKGLVTAGADLQSSDIPDLSSSYTAANAAITGDTKCKITYDSKGLVTAGADLQSSDIPDLSSSYVAKNSSITGDTKCKITYDSKGLVTAGADLVAADLPSHTHAATDITSGELPIANGGTGANTILNAVSNLKLTDTSGKTFPDSTHANYITRVQDYFVSVSEDKVPIVFNADWTTHGYGAAFGVTTTVGEKNRTLFLFNQGLGFQLYHQDNNGDWLDYSPNGTTLYWNQSGTSSTIALSESAENFQRIRVYYKNSDGLKEARDFHKPLTGVTVSLAVNGISKTNNAGYVFMHKIVINGTSLTFDANDGGYVKLGANQNTINITSGKILIAKVVGYKY